MPRNIKLIATDVKTAAGRFLNNDCRIIVYTAMAMRSMHMYG